jgi:DNA-binding CsgD family transcriptional regulator/PAS domain-containing protein
MSETSPNPGNAALLDLVGLLYDAATDSSRWRYFLEAGARHFGAFSANFNHFDEECPDSSMSFLIGYEDLPIEQIGGAIRKLTNMRHQDPRLSYSMDHPSKPFHCRQVMTVETLHASQSYREVLKPHGVEYTLLVSMSDSPKRLTNLAFFRSSHDQVFSQREVDDMGLLVPHLRRALSIQNQLAVVDHRLLASYELLESLPTGIVITRQSGLVEYANAAARRILEQRDGIEIDAEGGVWLPKQNGTALLLGALRRVGETGIRDAIALGRPSGRPAFHCLLSRLSAKDGDTLPNLYAEPRVALFLSDPDQALETSEELLQRLFGLTWAEARLLERLVAGNSLTDAAILLGIKVSTVRTQLKAIFKKTGTSSQVDLLRTVLSSPIWMSCSEAIAGAEFMASQERSS